MQKEVIIEKINHFLVEEFEVDQENIEPEAKLKETLELDSLDFVDLVVAIDTDFGIKLTGKDFTDVVTISDFYNLIERKLAA